MQNTHPIISRPMFGVKSHNNWHRERGYGKTLFLGSNQAWARLKNYNLKSRKQNFFTGIEKYHIFGPKYLRSGWKCLRLTNWYDTRHFSNDLFLRCLIWHRLSKKISFKHCLTPKNLIKVLSTIEKCPCKSQSIYSYKAQSIT